MLKITGAEKLADYIIEKVGFENILKDVYKIVTDEFGAIIKYCSYAEIKETGNICQDKDGRYIFKVWDLTHHCKAKFDVVTILGHFLINPEKDFEDFEYRWQANNFAESLLMPRERFIESYNKNSDPVALANEYDLTVSAIRVRIRRLGLNKKEEEYIWKIQHKPTGLFYCSRKGRFKNKITNLSGKGNFYTSLKDVEKIFKEQMNAVYINEAQVKKYNCLDNIKESEYSFGKAKEGDFIIKKYILKEMEE